MSFKKKTWKDRISEHPTRRTLTDVSNNTTKTVTVAREEGTISQEGDAFSAANMNDLEGRIAAGFSTLSQDSLKMSSSNPSSDSIKFGINASGQYGYIKQGASEVTPFRNPTGNASPSDVLSGKTFSTASLENASGTMTNHGGYTPSKSWARGDGTTYIRIPKGAYLTAANNGLDLPEVTVADNLYGQGEYNNNYNSGYNQGVTDADNRVNSSSANYKGGYNAGYSSGVSAGKGTNATVTITGGAGGHGGVNFNISLTVNSNGRVHVNSVKYTGDGGEPYNFSDGVGMGLTITGTDGSSAQDRQPR